MSLVEKWVFAGRKLKNNQSFIRFCRAFGIYKALSKLFFKLFDLLLSYKIGKNLIGTINVQGISFNFYDPTLDYLPQSALGETYEPAVTNHVKKLIQEKNHCFLDIGSHYGFYTAYIGALNPETEIHSFEPNSKFFSILTKNIEINNIKAEVYQFALSDSRGQIPFSNRSMKANDKNNLEIVESITFDELSEKNSIKPDIVKLDVHGGEGKVLFGMKKTLREYIKHIYLELHPNELLVDYSIKDIIDLLIASGFELFEINRFRRENMPEITKISNEDYLNLINQDKWTQEQIEERRMIYAKK
jgi:FkbM family methyltransferase